MMDPRLEKYFATDGDKFLFWVGADGYVSFEKFSVIFSDLQTDETEDERVRLYMESRNLPVLSWGALNRDTIK